MRTATVEIYSDATNAAIIRHPDRKFPGVLIQGDTLSNLASAASALSKSATKLFTEDEALDAQDLAERLTALVEHYKSVLEEHKIPLPF
jgi:heme oxygenase